MIHRATDSFWRGYHTLPETVQKLAVKNFDLLKSDPRHPSLHFKRVGELWSVRVGLHHRALALGSEDTFDWFWIGDHREYERLIG